MYAARVQVPTIGECSKRNISLYLAPNSAISLDKEERCVEVRRLTFSILTSNSSSRSRVNATRWSSASQVLLNCTASVSPYSKMATMKGPRIIFVGGPRLDAWSFLARLAPSRISLDLFTHHLACESSSMSLNQHPIRYNVCCYSF